MSARLVDGILCDYSLGECERLAMDGALPSRARDTQRSDTVLTIDTDEALRDHELAKLIPHLHRL